MSLSWSEVIEGDLFIHSISRRVPKETPRPLFFVSMLNSGCVSHQSSSRVSPVISWCDFLEISYEVGITIRTIGVDVFRVRNGSPVVGEDLVIRTLLKNQLYQKFD